ncbi:hypothetical protein PQX77_007478 [Marasmius sp. AFHP31]|nr:hypothetical protein PQX77_013182 [Marasmius sp. AFHP31]KAK1229460.1 hypothetical protein PQX77_007478 [Marasmius sp. AFHP31]
MSRPPSEKEIQNYTALGIARKTTVHCTLEMEENWGRSPTIKFRRWIAESHHAVHARVRSEDRKHLYQSLFNVMRECDRDALLNASSLKHKMKSRNIPAIERLPVELITEVSTGDFEMVQAAFAYNKQIVLQLPMIQDYFTLGMCLWQPKRMAAGYLEPMGGMSELDWVVLMMGDCCDICGSDWDVRLLWDKQMHLGICCVVGVEMRDEDEYPDSDDSDSESLSRGYSREHIYGTDDFTFSYQHIGREYPRNKYPQLAEIGDLSSILPCYTVMKEVEGPGRPQNPPELMHYDDRYFFSDLNKLIESFNNTSPNERAAFLQRSREELVTTLAQQQLLA